MGVFGFAEIIVNLGSRRSTARSFTDKVNGPVADQGATSSERAPAVLRGTALGSVLGILPGGGALLASFASYTVEKKLAQGPVAVRQGRDPGRRRARVGQQRRRADLVHPAADARHPAQRGDGADGRRDDHPQHPAGPAGDDQQPAAVLGPDRLDVGRQPDAGRPEPAADRHVDQAADGALPLPVPGDPAVLRIGVYTINNNTLRRLHDGDLRLRRLRLRQARAASRRRCCSASSSGR